MDDTVSQISLAIYRELGGTYLTLAQRLQYGGKPALPSRKSKNSRNTDSSGSSDSGSETELASDQEIDGMIYDYLIKAMHYYEKCGSECLPQQGVIYRSLGNVCVAICQRLAGAGGSGENGGSVGVDKKTAKLICNKLELMNQYFEKAIEIYLSVDVGEAVGIQLTLARFYLNWPQGRKPTNLVTALEAIFKTQPYFETMERIVQRLSKNQHQEKTQQQQKQQHKESRQAKKGKGKSRGNGNENGKSSSNNGSVNESGSGDSVSCTRSSSGPSVSNSNGVERPIEALQKRKDALSKQVEDLLGLILREAIKFYIMGKEEQASVGGGQANFYKEMYRALLRERAGLTSQQQALAMEVVLSKLLLLFPRTS